MHMRRSIAATVAALGLVLTGCTTDELLAAAYLARETPATAGIPCPQWVGTSRQAGFSDEQLRLVHTLMFRESRCDPTAYNPSGASGLMQIVRGWAATCGGTKEDLFDPLFNLRCAHDHVLPQQGWEAWSTYTG